MKRHGDVVGTLRRKGIRSYRRSSRTRPIWGCQRERDCASAKQGQAGSNPARANVGGKMPWDANGVQIPYPTHTRPNTLGAAGRTSVSGWRGADLPSSNHFLGGT